MTRKFRIFIAINWNQVFFRLSRFSNALSFTPCQPKIDKNTREDFLITNYHSFYLFTKDEILILELVPSERNPQATQIVRPFLTSRKFHYFKPIQTFVNRDFSSKLKYVCCRKATLQELLPIIYSLTLQAYSRTLKI